MEARLSEQLKYRNGLLMAKGLPRREASRAVLVSQSRSGGVLLADAIIVGRTVA